MSMYKITTIISIRVIVCRVTLLQEGREGGSPKWRQEEREGSGKQ